MQEPSSAQSAQDLPISFLLRAPTGYAWWVLAVVYLSTFAIPGHAILGILALITFMAALQDPFPHARSLWLWVVGMNAGVIVLSVAPTWKPTGLSLIQWFERSPGLMVLALVAAFLSVVVLVWHLSWLRKHD